MGRGDSVFFYIPYLMNFNLTKDQIVDLAMQSLNVDGETLTIRDNLLTYYNVAFKSLLESRTWNFTRKKVYFPTRVPPASENGLFGAFPFPADYISGGSASYVVGDNTQSTAISYQAEWYNKGGEILIYGWGDLLNFPEQATAGAPVRILFEYFSVPSEDKMPSAFSMALAYRLASIVAPKWAPEQQQQINALYNREFKNASRNDSAMISENQKQFRPRSQLLNPPFNRLGSDPTFFNYPGEPGSN